MERTEFTTRLAEALAAEDLSPATRAVTERQARQFEVWLRETTGEGIDPDDVRIASVDLMEYRSYLQRKDTTPLSVQRHYASIRKALLLLAPELTVKLKWPKLPTQQPTSPSGFTRNETHAIFRAAERLGPRDACIISLLMNAGCRASSLANLRLEDVDVHERGGTATFRQAKGNRTGVVPLNAHARAAVRAYLKVRPKGVDHGRLLCSDRFPFSPITRGVIWEVWHVRMRRHLPEAVGVKIRGPHQARHACAKAMQDRGVPLSDISAVLFHADQRVTFRYLRPSQEDLRRAVERQDLRRTLEELVGDEGEE